MDNCDDDCQQKSAGGYFISNNILFYSLFKYIFKDYV